MKVFLHGIGGVGMSSLAGLFKEKGHQVLGSDNQLYPPVDQILRDMDVKVFHPFDVKNIPNDIDLSIMGNIISRGNPEAEYILNGNFKYHSMAEALYEFFIKGKKSIVVAGTHGKTTVCSFISFLLHKAGLNPGFFIGGKPINFNNNYALGKDKGYFVIEGDEYETSFFDRSSKFLKYHPFYLILTSMEYDHLDFFKSKDQYLYSFTNLVNQVPSAGLMIVNGDYKWNQQVIKKAFTPIVSYGKKGTDVNIKDIEWGGDGYQFTLQIKNKVEKYFTPLRGEYNIWNLCAGIILGQYLGLDIKVIKEAVREFLGVKRRLNIIKEIDNTVFYEDFAHHPTSIKNVIKSIKMSYKGYYISTVLEPASASLRRNTFLNSLIKGLKETDELVLKETERVRNIPIDNRLNTSQIIKELLNQGKKAKVCKTYDEIKKYLTNMDFTQKRVVILMSNGSFGGLPKFVKGLKS